jgi:hypothetical protein
VHPSNSEAWKALDNFDTDFARDARNVRIELAIDAFTSYNLLPTLCMKYEYMFMCLIIPGPIHSGPRINVMQNPLIEELKQLWE